MSRSRKNQRQSANAAADRAFLDAWLKADQRDRRLVPGQPIPVPLDMAEWDDDVAEIRCRVRCRECSQVLGIVFDWSTLDGGVTGRKFSTNDGYALIDDTTSQHMFTFACCGWSAGRTGADLNKKLGTIRLP